MEERKGEIKMILISKLSRLKMYATTECRINQFSITMTKYLSLDSLLR